MIAGRPLAYVIIKIHDMGKQVYDPQKKIGNKL